MKLLVLILCDPVLMTRRSNGGGELFLLVRRGRGTKSASRERVAAGRRRLSRRCGVSKLLVGEGELCCRGRAGRFVCLTLGSLGVRDAGLCQDTREEQC